MMAPVLGRPAVSLPGPRGARDTGHPGSSSGDIPADALGMSVHLHRGTSLLVAGLALLALAFVGWTLESTILSPTALARSTPALLAQPTARAATVRSVERGITASLPAIADRKSTRLNSSH